MPNVILTYSAVHYITHLSDANFNVDCRLIMYFKEEGLIDIKIMFKNLSKIDLYVFFS